MSLCNSHTSTLLTEGLICSWKTTYSQTRMTNSNTYKFSSTAYCCFTFTHLPGSHLFSKKC